MKNLLIRVVSAVVAGIVFFGAYLLSVYSFIGLLIGICAYILFFEWPQFCKKDPTTWIYTPFYPVIPMVALILFCFFTYPLWPLALSPFLIPWAADTGGYVAGRLFGKTKIAPKISPKKSWEGFCGSVCFIFLILLFLFSREFFRGSIFFTSPRFLIGLFVSSVAFAFIALAGDLWESYLKRKAGIKDSGSIMPGHGGLLDRFDSVLFVVVALTALSLFFVMLSWPYGDLSIPIKL